MISKVLFNVMASSENKIVIITGCSSGIGLATTLIFLSQKARVFGIDMSPFTHELDAICNESFTFHKADLCKLGAAENAISACIARYGPRIDVLSNVAGVMDAFSSADTVKDFGMGARAYRQPHSTCPDDDGCIAQHEESTKWFHRKRWKLCESLRCGGWHRIHSQ
jgi:NAD(P)-dependent dehydrogenase (short-subunit alcohol dehydrogenase family)